MNAFGNDRGKSSGKARSGRLDAAPGAAGAGERHGGFWTPSCAAEAVAARNAAGRVEVGFIALWTDGHEKRPNPKARPHDRTVTRVGAQVASQRCPILRTGRRSIPQNDAAGAEMVLQ
jgi:hypothetical protein